MRDILDICRRNGKIFSSFKPIEPKELASRKRVSIYLGVDLKKYYTVVMYLSKKSRVLRKEVTELMELHVRLEKLNGTKIVKKCIAIDAPLCSKAKAMLVDDGWQVIVL